MSDDYDSDTPTSQKSRDSRKIISKWSNKFFVMLDSLINEPDEGQWHYIVLHVKVDPVQLTCIDIEACNL